jgi:hypothetical protein
MEEILTYFETLFQHLHEVTGVNHKDLGEDSRSSGGNLQLASWKL